jgi:hypothetical protein
MKGFEFCDQFGELLANEAAQIFRNISCQPITSFQTDFVPTELHFDDNDMAEEFTYLGSQKRIVNGEPQYYQIFDLQVIRINNVMFLGMPGEPVNEINLRMKSLLRQQSSIQYPIPTYITNGQIGYILTPFEWDVGGYERTLCIGGQNSEIIEKTFCEIASKITSTPIKWDPSIKLSRYKQYIHPRWRKRGIDLNKELK